MKNYRRHPPASLCAALRAGDEIGTPFCITVDFDSVDDNSVTIRHRDTMHQERISIDSIVEYFEQKFRV